MNRGTNLLIAIFALASAMLIVSVGHCGEPTLAERIARVAPAVAWKGKPASPMVDAYELGAAIAVWEPNPDRAAMLLALAAHESRLRATISLGECGPHECDRDSRTHEIRAWGTWQQHSNAYNRETWGEPDLDAQAFWAARALRAAWSRCGHYPGVVPALGAIRAYAGGGCDMPLRGEDERLATFEMLRKRIW